MESIKTQVNSNQTTSTLDFKDDLKGLSKKQKEEVLSEIGDVIVTKILESCADAKSPITGKAFHKLSDNYKEKKKEETGSTAPNLDLTGSMLSSLEFKIKKDKLEIGVYGEDAPKADGHNNFSGQSKLPTRQFLPKRGQSFDSDIEKIISETIEQYKADNLTLDDRKLSKIETKKELYDYLKQTLGDYERSRLKELALSSELSVALDKFNLLDLL